MELLCQELRQLYTEIMHRRRQREESKEEEANVQPQSLLEEVTACLSVLPPVVLRMSDRASQERALLASNDGERLWNFWQRALAPPLTLVELHTDFPRPPIQTYHGDVYHFKLPVELVAGLRALAKEEKVTMVNAAPRMRP